MKSNIYNKITLRDHQMEIATANRFAEFLVWEPRVGKSYAAIAWGMEKDDYVKYHKPILIVCPKGIVQKWKDDCEAMGAWGIVVSKEQFKKLNIAESSDKYSSLIFDEIHWGSGRLFYPARSKQKRSQIAEAVYNFLSENDHLPRMLLTATPIRSNPWNLHTLMCFLGEYRDWEKWRDYFEHKVKHFWQRYEIWEPKEDWRIKIQKVLTKYAHIKLLRDVADIGEETETIEKFKTERKTIPDEWEPMAVWHEKHREEALNPLKIERIKELGDQYRKIMVICYYTQQVDLYREELGKDKQVYVIDGRTEDGSAVAKMAEADGECYLIVQSTCAEGWSFSSASLCIFASLDHAYIKYRQAKGRLYNIEKRDNVEFIHFIGGSTDKAVYERIMLGKDFDPGEFLRNKTSYEEE